MNNPYKAIEMAVVGSVNLDLVARVHQFPEPGETISDATIQHHAGGKGGNQALAARRLGAAVQLLACVGQDAAADQALANLVAEGVQLDFCRRLNDAPTGQALILVSDSGENQIVVAPGANAVFEPQYLELPAAKAVIAQLEVPMATILLAAQQCNGLFCLNAAPARPVPKEVLALVDLLIVNEVEQRTLAENLRDYKGLLAVTYGKRGATLAQKGKIVARGKPPAVHAVDTTGAGDAFTAALTYGLASDVPVQVALDLACHAGALTATRAGAQSSPVLAELLEAATKC